MTANLLNGLRSNFRNFSERALIDNTNHLVESEGVEVGVFKLGGEFFAYESVCPHIGGPACQGMIITKVGEVVADQSAAVCEHRRTFS